MGTPLPNVPAVPTTPAAVTAPPAAGPNALAAGIRRDFPNYDRWNAADLKQLPDGFLGTILSSYGFRDVDAGEFVPASFRTRYGDTAQAEFIHAVLNEAAMRRDRTGRPTAGIHHAWVNGILGQGGIAPGAPRNLNPVFPLAINDANTGQVVIRNVTPPSQLNNDLTSIVLDLKDAKDPTLVTYVAMAPEAIAALKRVNPQYKPDGKIPEFIVGDETAVMGGYSTSRGYSSDATVYDVAFNSRAACGASQTVVQALTPNQPEVPVVKAWLAGYMMGEIDKTLLAMRSAPTQQERDMAANSLKAMLAECPERMPTAHNDVASPAAPAHIPQAPVRPVNDLTRKVGS